MAFWAVAGAVGLIGGGIDLGEPVTSRLPLQSPVLAGLALLAFVAVPMTCAAVAAAHGSRYAGVLLLSAGALLVAWIVAEALIIRTYSWMQPACAAWGVLVAWLGLTALDSPRKGRT